MTVVETLLVFVGAPLAIIAVLALLTLRRGKGAKRMRYKPGQPWEHPPVWYEPHPEHGPAAGSGETLAIGSSVYGEPTQDGARGGHGAGQGHGATAVAAAAPRPNQGGPLGGARGTW